MTLIDPKTVLLAGFLGCGPVIVHACETIAITDLPKLLLEEYAGGPDRMILQELRIKDINNDANLDAYAVFSFWVSGGAGDAASVTVFQGNSDGVCRDPKEFTFEVADPTALTVTPVPTQTTGDVPAFDVTFKAPLSQVTGDGTTIKGVDTTRRFVFDPARFGYVANP